jgi:glycosyltransferase involved in cell wall biosynthesis
VVPDVRAAIFGAGARRERLIALADTLGVHSRVRSCGFLSEQDLVRAYQEADVFCIPLPAELQSLATTEATAAELPVIAADAMALPQLVQSRVNGLLYQPRTCCRVNGRHAARAGRAQRCAGTTAGS